RRLHPFYTFFPYTTLFRSVVGFPLGYNSTESKITEVKTAIENGANEIDMVVNIPEVKNRNYQMVEDEIRALKEACGDKILKVIRSEEHTSELQSRFDLVCR